jgi:hypothetical protein
VFDNTNKDSQILYDSDEICKKTFNNMNDESLLELLKNKLNDASEAIDRYNLKDNCQQSPWRLWKRIGYRRGGSMYKRRLTRRKKHVKKKIGKKTKRHGGNNKRKTKKRRN